MFNSARGAGAAAIYIRSLGGETWKQAAVALLTLAGDLGLGVFDIYLDEEYGNLSRRNAMLQQLSEDAGRGYFSTVLRMCPTYLAADRDFVDHSFGMLASEGIRVITLGGQYGDEACLN